MSDSTSAPAQAAYKTPAFVVAALQEALEFAEDREDVIDGSDGPQANDAMRLAQTLRAVIATVTGTHAPKLMARIAKATGEQP